MWWIWLVPSLVVAGALVALTATGLETWRKVRRVRAALDALATQAAAAADVVAQLPRGVGSGQNTDS